MKFKSIGFKTCLAALATTAGMMVIPDSPAYALSLSFKPTGRSFDADVAKDIRTSVGNFIDFQVFLETSGVAEDDKVKKIQYNLDYDPTELEWASFTNSGLFPTLSVVPPAPMALARITQDNGAVNPDLFNQLVGTVKFKVLPGLNNDGNIDFSLRFVSATDDDGELFSNISSLQAQRVEVQPVPTPALLPGLIGLGVGILRKRKFTTTEETEINV